MGVNLYLTYGMKHVRGSGVCDQRGIKLTSHEYYQIKDIIDKVHNDYRNKQLKPPFTIQTTQ